VPWLSTPGYADWDAHDAISLRVVAVGSRKNPAHERIAASDDRDFDDEPAAAGALGSARAPTRAGLRTSPLAAELPSPRVVKVRAWVRQWSPLASWARRATPRDARAAPARRLRVPAGRTAPGLPSRR